MANAVWVVAVALIIFVNGVLSDQRDEDRIDARERYDEPRLPYTFSCHEGGAYLGWKSEKHKGHTHGHGDAFCDSKRPRNNCPFFPRRYWCGEQYTQRILQGLNTSFAFDSRRFHSTRRSWAKLLRGKRILFVGDSVHSHLASSLMCLMKRYSDRKRYPLSAVYRESKKLGKFADVSSRRYFCVRLVSLNSWICYDRTTKAQHVLDALPTYKRMMSNTAYVVLNFGLHNPTLDVSPLRRVISGLKGELPTTTQLIWRESSPQHFANPGGVFSRDKLGIACAPIKDSATYLGNAINKAYEQVIREHALPVIRIWDDTRPFHFAHAVGECTHYCQPGISDYWSERLRILLQQQFGEDSATTVPRRQGSENARAPGK